MEFPLHLIKSDKLEKAQKMLQKQIPANEGWKISVLVSRDGIGNLVANCPKTGATKSVHLGKVEIK